METTMLEIESTNKEIDDAISTQTKKNSSWIEENDSKLKDVKTLGKSGAIISTIGEKSVVNYVNTIRHNLLIGRDALWYVCRHLADAYASIDGIEKSYLETRLRQFSLSRTTIVKYVAIGNDKFIQELFEKGISPSSWCTLYEIAVLSDEEKDELLKSKQLSSGITMEKVNEILKKKTSFKTSDDSSVMTVSVNKSGLDPASVSVLYNEIKNLVIDFNKNVDTPTDVAQAYKKLGKGELPFSKKSVFKVDMVSTITTKADSILKRIKVVLKKSKKDIENSLLSSFNNYMLKLVDSGTSPKLKVKTN